MSEWSWALAPVRVRTSFRPWPAQRAPALPKSECSAEDQLAAALSAARADIDHVIGRADDRFLVLDDEQRVAFVAQIVHHADEPADVARMQADARFVHDEERVHERSAEAGRQIHALHFAAAERARGAIEREIAEPDFAKIAQAARRLRSATSRPSSR